MQERHLQERWVGRRCREPQRAASSVGTTTGRHSQNGGMEGNARADKGRKEGEDMTGGVVIDVVELALCLLLLF